MIRVRHVRCCNCGKNAEEAIAVYDSLYCLSCAMLILLEKVERLESMLEEQLLQ